MRAESWSATPASPQGRQSRRAAGRRSPQAWLRQAIGLLVLMGATPLAYTQAGPGRLADNPVVRAQVTAARQAVLSSELAGKLLKLPFREGDAFKRGDTLAEFDCALHRARLSRSMAAESSARQQLDVANRLEQLNSISVSDLAQARSAVSVGQADSAVDRAMVQRCVIKAPFSGRVGETHVRVSEFVPEGKELLSIYEEGAFEVEMIVPSRWLVWLRPGYPFAVTLDETGLAHSGEVARIAGSVDPVSQSVRVIGHIAKDETGLLPGMSGSVSILPPNDEATASSRSGIAPGSGAASDAAAGQVMDVAPRSQSAARPSANR